MMSRRRKFAVVLTLGMMVTACTVESGSPRRQLGMASDCDVTAAACSVSDDGITVSLRMGPGVKPLEPFPLSLVIDGGEVAAQSVVADFQMQGMDMGSNRYRLKPQAGGWVGIVTLPVCTASRMDWHAIVEFSVDGKPVQAIFPFHTEAN